MNDCQRRKQLAAAYSSAAAALSRTVGEMNSSASSGAVELYRQARGEFIRAKRSVETSQAAMQAHEREHGCG